LTDKANEEIETMATTDMVSVHREALEKLVGHVFHDEEEVYNREGGPKDHVFVSVLRLHGDLNGYDPETGE